MDGRETVGNSLGTGMTTGWDGRETVGNSLGRAPVGRSDTGARTRWTEGEAVYRK